MALAAPWAPLPALPPPLRPADPPALPAALGAAAGRGGTGVGQVGPPVVPDTLADGVTSKRPEMADDDLVIVLVIDGCAA